MDRHRGGVRDGVRFGARANERADRLAESDRERTGNIGCTIRRAFDDDASDDGASDGEPGSGEQLPNRYACAGER